jgi:hypothetical protein
MLSLHCPVCDALFSSPYATGGKPAVAPSNSSWSALTALLRTIISFTVVTILHHYCRRYDKNTRQTTTIFGFN